MYLKIYKLEPSRFLSVPGLAWQESLKNTRVKFTNSNGYWLVINVRKRYQRWNMPRYPSI